MNQQKGPLSLLEGVLLAPPVLEKTCHSDPKHKHISEWTNILLSVFRVRLVYMPSVPIFRVRLVPGIRLRFSPDTSFKVERCTPFFFPRGFLTWGRLTLLSSHLEKLEKKSAVVLRTAPWPGWKKYSIAKKINMLKTVSDDLGSRRTRVIQTFTSSQNVLSLCDVASTRPVCAYHPSWMFHPRLRLYRHTYCCVSVRTTYPWQRHRIYWSHLGINETLI